MTRPSWDERYTGSDLPWDTGTADPHLVELFAAKRIQPCRVLEIGCGTGTNAIWLAALGFEVHASDISSVAIELATAKASAAKIDVRFAVLDFLAGSPTGGPFDLVFDRGVFHVFDEAAERSKFAARVAGVLAPGGQWLSLIGSTEGPPRDHGPPRRSAVEILTAVEPKLELLELRSTTFHADIPSEAMAWLMRARLR